MSIRPGATTLSPAVDDLGAFRHAGGADAAVLASRMYAFGDQEIADNIEVARRIDDPGIG